MTAPGAGPAARPFRLALAALIGLYAIVQLAHLGHGRIRHWDEVYHFKVAASLVADPLTPRLRVDPLRPVSPLDWWNTGVWLHKPPLPLWTSALSMKALGIAPFAFRLPSVLLGCLCIALTFWLGRQIAGDGAGLVAAALFAGNAFAIDLVQGVQFGDVTDIQLAAWNVLAVAFLVQGATTGRALFWTLAGAACGLAVLAKTFLALAPICLGPVAWALSRMGRLDAPAVKLRHVALQWLICLAVAGPVLLSLHLRFPEQFRYSMGFALGHIGGGVEPVWTHGVDWTWNEMLQRQHRPPLALFAAVAIVAFAAARGLSRQPASALVAIWLAATMAVLSIVRVKAPGQLFGAFPAACIAMAWLLVATLRRPSLITAALALGLAAQIATWPWRTGAAWVAQRIEGLRRVLPDVVAHPESARGLAFVVAALLLAILVGAALRAGRLAIAPRVLQACAALLCVAVAVAWPAFAVETLRDLRRHWWRGWTDVAARAIADHGPGRAAIFVDGDHFDERLDLELEAYTRQPALNAPGGPTDGDLQRAAAMGRASLLVSPRAWPFEALPQDLLRKRFEVYDLTKPRPGPASIAQAFGLREQPVSGPGATLLAAALDRAEARPGETLWLTTCWRVERPLLRSALQVQSEPGLPLRASQPIAYGLLDGRLRAGDSFCQRAWIDLPQDAPRGEHRLSFALGDLPPVASRLTLAVR